MSESILSPDEVLFVSNALAGSPTDFSGSPTRPVIAAELICRLVRGRPYPNDIGWEPGAVVVIDLKGARIRGPLKLEHFSGHAGASAPPLILEHCTFEDEIVLNFCYFSFLSLSHSWFSLLEGRGMRIDGDLDLSGIRGLPVVGAALKNVCRVFLPNSRVAGDVFLKKARLESAEPRDDLGRHYALFLASAQLEGSIEMRPEFSAEGGVQLSNAHVHGSIFADGATLSAREEGAAFRGQHLRLGGSLAVRAGDPTRPLESQASTCVIRGEVDLLHAEINGGIYMEGAHLEQPESYSLVLANARVGGSVNVSYFMGEAEPGTRSAPRSFRSGPLLFHEARIEGSLRMLGAEISSTDGVNSIELLDAYVGSDFSMGQALLKQKNGPAYRIRSSVDGSIRLMDAHIGGSCDLWAILLKTSQEQAINARNAFVGKNLRLRSESCRGEVNLRQVRVGVDLELSGAFPLEIQGAEVSGNMILEGLKGGEASVNAPNLTVKGHFVARGGFVEPEQEGGDALCLESGDFGGDVEVAGLRLLSKQSLAAEHKKTARPELSLKDARIGGALRVSGVRPGLLKEELADWAQHPPHEVRYSSLPFYPGWLLVEFLWRDTDKVSVLGYLHRKGFASSKRSDRLVLLDGLSAPIHDQNEKYLQLTDETVLDYAKFFCFFVWGDEGAFQVIESRRDLGDMVLEPEVPDESFVEKVKKQGDDTWVCEVMIRYDQVLFRSTLVIRRDGMITMTEDSPVAKIETGPAVAYDSPLRSLKPEQAVGDSTTGFDPTDLVCLGSRPIPPSSVYYSELAFYPGMVLVEFVWDAESGGPATLAYVRQREPAGPGSGPVYLLNGGSGPIHELNAQQLMCNDDTVLGYARFYCAFVWGEEGPFEVIESRERLGAVTLEPELDLEQFPEPAILDKGEELWALVVPISYAQVLYLSALIVRKDGLVHMQEDKPLARLTGGARIAYEPPVRRLITEDEDESGVGSQVDDEALVRLLHGPRLGASRSSVSAEECEREFEILEKSGQWLSITDEQQIADLKALGSSFKLEEGGEARVSLERLRAHVFDYKLLPRSEETTGDLEENLLIALDGFEYDSIEVKSEDSPVAPRSEKTPEKSTVEASDSSATGNRPGVSAKQQFGSALGIGEETASAEDEQEPGIRASAEQYRHLLNRQYPENEPKPEYYKPQPYEQLSRVLRHEGYYDVSRAILLEKLSLDRRFLAGRVFPQVWLKHKSWLLRKLAVLPNPFTWILDHVFDFGLRARKSVTLFFAIWFLGTCFFLWANRTPSVMVVDTLPQPPGVVDLVVERYFNAVLGAGRPLAATDPEQPCGDLIDSALYALDVIVPILDLRQEIRCAISSKSEAWPWRIAKTLLAIVGGIVTAMAVLSVSGVLRRNIER